MARPAKFNEESILDAAARLCAAGGVEAVTAAAVARETAAPSGSIYHRYSGRGEIRAALWMRTVERFQSGYVARLEDGSDPTDSIVNAAIYAIQWCRDHPAEARILVLHRREEFLDETYPKVIRQRAGTLNRRMVGALRALAAALDPEAPDLEQTRLAATGIPLAAIRPYLVVGRPPPPSTEVMVEGAIRAVLGSPRRLAGANSQYGRSP